MNHTQVSDAELEAMAKAVIEFIYEHGMMPYSTLKGVYHFAGLSDQELSKALVERMKAAL